MDWSEYVEATHINGSPGALLFPLKCTRLMIKIIWELRLIPDEQKEVGKKG